MFEAKPDPRAQGRCSRVSVSLPEPLLEQLQQLAQREGRSLSNLCARLLERSVADGERLD
jgi:metal-responsive CopG/Arc/MetJ family transcriptional regulator